MLGWYLFECPNKALVEFFLEFIIGDCADEVREDKVCTLEADCFHYFQKLVEELGWLELSLVQLHSVRVEFGDVLVGEKVLQLELEIFIVEFGVHEGDESEFFEIESLIFLGNDGLFFL